MKYKQKKEKLGLIHKFANGQIDIYYFVEKCYQTDISNKIYEKFFEDFSKSPDFPNNICEKDFLDLGAELYYFMDKLNKRLHIYHPYGTYDKTLIFYITERILKKFPKHFPHINDSNIKVESKKMRKLLSDHLETKKDIPNTIDFIKEVVDNQFRDKQLVTIDNDDSTVYIRLNKPDDEIPPNNRNFKKYFDYLRKERGLLQRQIAEWCGMLENNFSSMINGDDKRSLSKDILYKIIVILKLEQKEYNQLITFAKMRKENIERDGIYDIKDGSRDQFIINFIDQKYDYPPEKLIRMLNEGLAKFHKDPLTKK